MAIIDSYAQSNRDGAYSQVGTGYAGQSFYNATSTTLNEAYFNVYGDGSGDGTVEVRLYAHTGTYGTSSNKTGSILATSDAINYSSLPTTSSGWQKFTFSGGNIYTLAASTYYCLEVYTSNTDSQTNVGYDGSSPTHGGNAYTNFGARTYDLVFSAVSLVAHTKVLADPMALSDSVSILTAYKRTIEETIEIADAVRYKRRTTVSPLPIFYKDGLA